MAGVASHTAVGVREGSVIARQLRWNDAVLIDKFRPHGLLTKVSVARSNGVQGLNDFPLQIRIRHGMLKKLVAAPFETLAPPGSVQNFERVAACPAGPRRGCGPRGDKSSLVADRAMAIHAVDFDSGTRFTKNLSIAVIVRGEVAIVALHAFFEVDVGEVNGFREPLRIIKGNLPAVPVQPVAFAIMTEDRSEYPTVAVKVRELRRLQLRVEFGAAHFVQEFFVAPEPASGGAFRIADESL